MDTLSFTLGEFEGPLDLLLHLISKHKMDICDVDISSLVDQYTLYIDKMQSENLEISSEFLHMAARLVYMKSVMLLPKHDELDELKEELQGQLIEYQIIKEIAENIGGLYCGGEIFSRDPVLLPIDYTYTRIHDPIILRYTLLNISGKRTNDILETKPDLNRIVNRPVISVDSKIVYILGKLFRKNTLYYESLFSDLDNKSDMVATFLAILELVKSNRVRLSDDLKTVSSVVTGEFEKSGSA